MAWLSQHAPCPCGDSSDAYSINDQGWGICFSCEKKFPPATEDTASSSNSSKPSIDRADYVSTRGISKATMEFYGSQTEYEDNIPVRSLYKYPKGAIKYRNLVQKSFWWKGKANEEGCFGLDKFDPGSKPFIVITEGEEDCMAAYEMLFKKGAVVSVKSASSAKQDCIRDFAKINSFDKIILCFDNDGPGKEATQKVSQLFDYNKVYLAKMELFKDPCEYVKNNRQNEFQKLVENSRRFSPESLINSFAEIEKALESNNDAVIGRYPFSQLNERLYGLHRGEVIVFKGDEGIGKTEVFRAIEHSLLKNTKAKIGILHFEEENGTTIKGLASYELNKPCTLPDCGVSKEDILNAYKTLVGNDESRTHLHLPFVVEDVHEFLNNIRFLVSGAGCDVVFLDHISWLATGEVDGDERKRLDLITQKLKQLAIELKFCLVMISHVNDDGKTRGSRNVTKVANTVVHLSRNKIAPTIEERNMLEFVVEKARLGGRTGPAGYSIFDNSTGTLLDIAEGSV